MAGSYGKLELSAYGHNQMTAQRIEDLETALAAWLASAPGSFSSPDACEPYHKARRAFNQWAGRSDGHDAGDNFEIGLARRGFRAGVVVFDGAPFWILVLPSSVDTALTRMADMESRSA